MCDTGERGIEFFCQLLYLHRIDAATLCTPMSPVLPANSELPTFVQGSIVDYGDSYLVHQSEPFLLVPSLDHSSRTSYLESSPTLPSPTMRPRPSFPVDLTHRSKLQQQLNQSTFKAPAHKHAHHLHSIPPKEKTTRTLILDHMLWLHGKARFSQARVELGMVSHPEEEADDDYGSDGETVDVLGYGLKNGKSSYFSGREAASSSSSSGMSQQARGFKAKADGLEKVLSAMLDQPPEDLPFDADDLLFRDTSFVPPSTPTLPNGVRLRLAIAGLVNDFFAQDDQTVPLSPSIAAGLAPSTYTPSLFALARISSFAHHSDLPILPSFQTFSATASAGANSQASLVPPAGSIFSTIPRGAGPEGPWALGSAALHLNQASSPDNSRHTSGYPSFMSQPSRPQFAPGSSSYPSRGMATTSRYPMSIPLEMDSSSAPPPRVFRAVGRSRDLYSAGAHAYPVRPGESSQRPRRCPRHLSINCPPSATCAHSAVYLSPKHTKSRYKSSIGAGLTNSGPPLRRSPFLGNSRGKEARMTDLIPRFLRLSALVAVELGREARGEEWDALAQMDLNLRRQARERDGVIAGPSSFTSQISSESDDEAAGAAHRSKKALVARPSREWYALLTALLTRAVLQGYLVKGWKGTEAVEILLGVGTGTHNPLAPGAQLPASLRGTSVHPPASSSATQDDESDDEDEEEKMYEPDEMPDLTEAWDVLFGLKTMAPAPTTGYMASALEGLEEYEKVMMERTSEVCFKYFRYLCLF